MLYFDRIDVSEWIDANKTSASKEFDICHYRYFLNFNFKFKPNANDVYETYHIDAKLKNANAINAKGWFHWKQGNIIKHKILLTRIKMGEKILTFQDLEIEKKIFLPQLDSCV